MINYELSLLDLFILFSFMKPPLYSVQAKRYLEWFLLYKLVPSLLESCIEKSSPTCTCKPVIKGQTRYFCSGFPGVLVPANGLNGSQDQVSWKLGSSPGSAFSPWHFPGTRAVSSTTHIGSFWPPELVDQVKFQLNANTGFQSSVIQTHSKNPRRFYLALWGILKAQNF